LLLETPESSPSFEWQHQDSNLSPFNLTSQFRPENAHGFISNTSSASASWQPLGSAHAGSTASDNIPAQAYLPPVLFAPCGGFSKKTVEKEQEEILVQRRAEGVGFNEIAEEIRQKTGVEVTRNALVKRYQKILDSYLVVSSFLHISIN